VTSVGGAAGAAAVQPPPADHQVRSATYPLSKRRSFSPSPGLLRQFYIKYTNITVGNIIGAQRACSERPQYETTTQPYTTCRAWYTTPYTLPRRISKYPFPKS
jgi:hypothetical protein